MRIKNMQAEIIRLKSDNDALKTVIVKTLWMARRYSHGRSTYAPSMFRDAYETIVKWFPELIPFKDDVIKPPEPKGSDTFSTMRSDYLDDCNLDPKEFKKKVGS